MKIETIECDVLCVGGGIAGLMAAINAAEHGAKVVVADKGNTLRSGAGATGNDHFTCYIPEVHGTLEALLKDRKLGEGFVDDAYTRLLLEKAFDMVKLWDSWGIPMKYEGRYEFAGHIFPGHMGASLKYAGQMQKPVLTRQAISRGVKIANRVMVCELVGNGSVTGAVGIDTRDDRQIQFIAKSIVLATGPIRRLYQAFTPASLNNSSRGISSIAGDGRAMAYNIGAELTNMEMLRRHAGPKYLSREGQATWVGVLRDPQDKPVGPFLKKPDRRYSDIITEVNKQLFEQYARSAKGPVYFDCRGISDEDYDYMMHWQENEGNTGLINYLNTEGIDLKKNPIEFMTYELTSSGIIRTNLKTETTVKGLYAAGEETRGGISESATSGWIAGENAADYAKQAGASDEGMIKEKSKQNQALIKEIRGRQNGPDWKEVNIAMQQTMSDYAGLLRTSAMLDQGLTHLRRIKEKAHAGIIAGNQHEMMRVLEIFNLLEMAELVFLAALERKETRGMHVRAEYPYTNPLDNRLVILKKVEGKPAIEWRSKGS